MKGLELLAYARWLRLKGYLRLKKWEHLELILRTPILDLLVPDINTPILRMSRYIRPWIERGKGNERRREIRAIEEMLSLQKPPLKESETRYKWKGFVEKYKPPPRFAAHGSACALKGFARQLLIGDNRGTAPMSSRKRWDLKSWDHERRLSDEVQDDTLLDDGERQWRRINPAHRFPLPYWGGQKPRATDEEEVFCEHDPGTNSNL